jgi:hypothetical protein
MSKDIYVEEKRKMKTIGAMEEVGSVELMKPQIDQDTGELIYENNLGDALFDVAVDVGPSSSSRRDATVRALTGMMQVTSDPTTQQVLQAMAIMNMEGEGIGDIKEFFRKQLVQMGVLQPTEEEQMMMMEAQANVQPDPQSAYLMAEAAKAQAQAIQAQANTEYTLARAEETKAKTAETISNIDIDQRKSAIETAEKIGAALQPQANVVPPSTQLG